MAERDVSPVAGARAAPVRAAVEQFSTEGLREPERIDLWEQHNARALVGLRARTLGGGLLQATERTLRLDEFQFAHVEANAHVVERDAREIAETPREGVALYFALSGESMFYHEEGVHLQRPGELLVCDVDRPFLRGFARGLRELVLTVPRAVFEDASEGRLPARPVTLGFAGTVDANAHAAALADMVKSTLTTPDGKSLASVESTARALLGSVFSPDQAHAAQHRASALLYIDRHLRDPRLSVGQVARAVGLSERHLTRAFRETGIGVARAILERRLELARKILSSPGAPPVGAVAGQCGFSSHAHFTRVFRERFEETPNQFRSRRSA